MPTPLRSRRIDAVAPAAGQLRVARACVVGLSAALLAYLGHLSAGGSAIAPVVLIGLALLGTGVAWLCGRRQWSLAELVALLVGAQCVLHLWFSLAADTVGAHAGHLSSMAPMPGMVSAPRMWLAHLVSAVLTALVLRRGELWVWTLLAFLTRRLLVAPVWVLSTPPLRRLAVPQPQMEPLLALLCASVLARRGPPVLAG